MGRFRPIFVRPNVNFVRPRLHMFEKQPMQYNESAVQQMISELSAPVETEEQMQARIMEEKAQQAQQPQNKNLKHNQSTQQEQPKKKRQLLDNMFPSKVKGMKNDSFGSLKEL